MTANDLWLEHLTVGWDGTPVLNGIDLRIEAGSTLALLGESGSGKSTLLRTIAGLLPVLGGRIRLGTRDLTHEPPERRWIGMVFQSHALFPHLTASGNVAFAGRLRGRSTAQTQVEAERWLDRVGLQGLGAQPVDELSGGQRQRVALARTLAAEPDVVLLDEPLGALDAGLRADLLGDLRRLFQDLGTTVVHVTHDPVEAASLAHDVAVLDAGGIAQVGPPSELHDTPATAVVARLVGHPNVVRGIAIGLLAPEGRPIGVIPANAIELIDHPSNVGDTPVALPLATVEVVSPGATWSATVRVDDGPDLVVTLDDQRRIRTGDRVRVLIDETRVRWVPRHSAERPAG